MNMIARDAGSPQLDSATHRTNRAPRWLWVASLMVVAVVVAPLAYIIVEVARQPSWSLIWSGRTAELLFNTTVLVAAVTITATTIGVGAAWAVTRVKLPMPALWTSVLALPLVIPSYVAALAYLAASGPNGMFAPLCWVRGWHCRSPPIRTSFSSVSSHSVEWIRPWRRSPGHWASPRSVVFFS